MNRWFDVCGVGEAATQTTNRPSKYRIAGRVAVNTGQYTVARRYSRRSVDQNANCQSASHEWALYVSNNFLATKKIHLCPLVWGRPLLALQVLLVSQLTVFYHRGLGQCHHQTSPSVSPVSLCPSTVAVGNTQMWRYFVFEGSTRWRFTNWLHLVCLLTWLSRIEGIDCPFMDNFLLRN